MKIILGTGQLGNSILEVLKEKHPSEDILLVNKSGKVGFKLPEKVSVIGTDVTSANAIKNIIRDDTDTIYSCTDVPYKDWGSFYPATTRALIEALENTEVKLIFADNLYSYGNVKGLIMNEGMPHTATTKKGLIRANVITEFLQSNRSKGLRGAIVKAADFIGPNINKGVFGTDFLNKLYQNKRVMLFGNIHLFHSFTYIRDFAEAMVTISNAEDVYGQVWHVPNAPAITLHQWLGLFEKKIDRKAKIRIINKRILQIAGLFSPLMKEFVELSYQFEYPYLVNHGKYITRFGNHYTPHEEIVDKTVQWYQSTLKL